MYLSNLHCSNWNETKVLNIFVFVCYTCIDFIKFYSLNCKKVKKITVTAVNLENLGMSYENTQITLDGMDRKISTKQWREKKILQNKGRLKF